MHVPLQFPVNFPVNLTAHFLFLCIKKKKPKRKNSGLPLFAFFAPFCAVANKHTLT